jgi:uncharacterized lipoprotein YddW (UPF0748 family)
MFLIPWIGSCQKTAMTEQPQDPSLSALVVKPSPFNAEVIVRSANNLSSPAAVSSLIRFAKANKITTLSVAVKQDEDDEYPSGTVFYNSQIAPRAFGNFDGFGDLLTKAHAAGLKVRAWIPQFHDQVAFRKDPSWAMKALINGEVVTYTGSPGVHDYFVNPLNPQVQDYERSIIQEVLRKYDVDSVMLDWLRFDNWNMDLSDTSRAAFKADYGYDPLGLIFNTDNGGRSEWQDWRTRQIGNYVAAVRADVQSLRPSATLGVYVLPQAADTDRDFAEVGQDAAMFKDSIDVIAPMCYYTDWGYSIDWVVSDCIQTTFNKVGANVKIIPTLDLRYSSSAYTQINRNIRTNFPQISQLGYFGYGTWTNSDFANVNTFRKY